MRFELLLKGGAVASGEGVFNADVGISNGKIAEVGSLSEQDSEETIDVSGLTVFPGVIDTQVHFREPGMEHKEDLATGTESAVFGGVTSIFEMPNTIPPTTTREALEDKLARADGRAWCNYAFFIGAATDNLEQLAELEVLPGTPGIKIFVGSSTGTLLVPDDENIRRVLQNGRYRCPIHSEDTFRLNERKGLLSQQPTAHEHHYLRDAECARLATERVLDLAYETGRPVHILHLSTADEIPLLFDAKDKGIDVTVEITPQHLWFAAPEAYDRLGTLAQMNPPIRSEEHRAALRQALRDGLFDVTGSDHAPHTLEEKSKPYPESPSGMPGVQTLLPAMLTLASQGLLDLPQLVTLIAEGPARIYGVRDKGKVRPGFDADLAVVDLKARRVLERSWIRSKCGWSPFEGQELTGWPIHTIVGGNLVIREGELQGSPQGHPVRFWR